MRRSDRSSAAKQWRKLYDTAQWKRMRDAQLTKQPLCQFCLQLEDVTEATVVDHAVPHKGDPSLFFDEENLQSLCSTCHDSHKQRIERGGTAQVWGADGYPIDIYSARIPSPTGPRPSY